MCAQVATPFRPLTESSPRSKQRYAAKIKKYKCKLSAPRCSQSELPLCFQASLAVK